MDPLNSANPLYYSDSTSTRPSSLQPSSIQEVESQETNEAVDFFSRDPSMTITHEEEEHVRKELEKLTTQADLGEQLAARAGMEQQSTTQADLEKQLAAQVAAQADSAPHVSPFSVTVNSPFDPNKEVESAEVLVNEALEEKDATEEAPVEEKATEEAVVEEKTAEEAVLEEKATQEAVVEEKATEETVAEEKTTQEAVVEEKATEEAVQAPASEETARNEEIPLFEESTEETARIEEAPLAEEIPLFEESVKKTSWSSLFSSKLNSLFQAAGSVISTAVNAVKAIANGVKKAWDATINMIIRFLPKSK